VTEASASHVSVLSTTPVKGLGLEHPEQVELISTGAVGDRDFFFVDERGSLASVTKIGALVALRAEYDRDRGRLAIVSDNGGRWEEEVRLGDRLDVDFFGHHRVATRRVAGPWDAVASERAGRTLMLVKADEPGAGSDYHPVTILGDASVAELARASGLLRIDRRRFRMLIGLDTSIPHIEDTWTGATVEVGEAMLRVCGPVPRCAATTRGPDSGERDLPVVKMIRDHRGIQPTDYGPGANFGVYADVLRHGTVRVGDSFRIVANEPARNSPTMAPAP